MNVMTEADARAAVTAEFPEVAQGDACRFPDGDWFVWEMSAEACYVVDSLGDVSEYVRTTR